MRVPSRTRAALEALLLQAPLGARRLSGAARASLASELLLLALGLRSAVLLSLPSSAADALAAVLQRWTPPLDAKLRVWLHASSGALGALNVDEVLRSAAEPAQPACVDVRAESMLGTVLPSLPGPSQALLDALLDVCERLARSEEREAGLLLLHGGPREAGVALAGWLLGYSVLYCLGPHDCASTSSAQLVRQLPASAQAEAAWDAAAPNNLADAPLVLFQARLGTPAPGDELYAFSVPQAALADVARKLAAQAALPAAAAPDARACREALLALLRQRLHARRQRAVARLLAAAPAARDGELLGWLETLVLDASCQELSLPLVAL